MLHAQIPDGAEFCFGEDLADRVVWRVQHDHPRLLTYHTFEFVHVQGPIRAARLLRPAPFRGVQGDVPHHPARHDDVRDVLVEEGFEEDDLVAGLDERHECGEHPLVCSRGYGYFGGWVQGVGEVRGAGRVGCCDGLF